MANKYIIHGATYCGDGTASNEAASAGASGAWNDINVFEGTAPAYGTAPAAGDVVYIRSKTSAGADITRTLAANVTLGSSSATAASWVTWVIDGGTIWSGINGTLTYSCPSTYSVTQRSYNDIRAEVEDRFVISTPAQSTSIARVVFNADTKNKNWLIDFSANTNSFGDNATAETEFNSENLHYKNAHYYQSLITFGSTSKATLINPKFELTALPNANESSRGVLLLGSYGGNLIIIGGRVFGIGATNSGGNFINGSSNSGKVTLIGFQVPKAMNLAIGFNTLGVCRTEAMGLDGGSGGAVFDIWGNADSRQDGYYPTLNAFFPDSANTPWSWKIYPSNGGPQHPLSMPVSKIYTDSAATKTIDVEVLIADSFTGASKNTVWIDVVYTDATTGLPVFLTTRDLSAAALASSTAAWTLTYGGDSTKVSIPLVGLFSKKSLSIATPTSIKQNTPIYVTLFGTIKSASALDYLFFDPDFGVL